MNVVACTPVKGGWLPSVPGTKTVPCSNCSALVWVSPASQKMLLDKENQPFCLHPCSTIKLLELRSTSGEEVEFHGVTGWEDEARPYIGEDGVTDVKAFLIEINEATREG